MERVETIDHGWADVELDEVDAFEVFDGEPPPPPPPDDPRPEPPRRPGRPRHPADAEVFSARGTLIGATLFAASLGIQIVIITLGARGGELAVYAISAVFAVLYLGVFMAGSWWLGAHRRAR